MIVSILITVLMSAYVIYCLFNGSKIHTETMMVKRPYWLLSGVTLAFIVFILSKRDIFGGVLFIICLLMGTLYSSIPSGFNDKGIYLRGIFYPYRTIRNMYPEYVKDRYRLNFMYKGRQYFLDVKEDDFKILKECERLYKKESNR